MWLAIAAPVHHGKDIAYAVFTLFVAAVTYLIAKNQRNLTRSAMERWASENGFTSIEYLKQVPDGWEFGPSRSHTTIRARMTSADGSTRIGYFDLGFDWLGLVKDRQVYKVIWEDEIASYH